LSLNGVNAQLTGGFLLTNQDNLIQGLGNIGANQMSFLNQAGGLVNANVNGQILLLDPPNLANGFVNHGLVEATNGGILQLTGNAGGAFINTGATILADGNGSEVQLLNSASVSGGTLGAANGGVIRAVTGQTVFLTNVTLSGAYIDDNNADTHLSGTITN